MPLSEEEQEALIAQGWQVLHDIIYHGKVSLKGGEEKKASTREILAAAQFLASKRPPKERKVPVLDHHLRRTDG